MKRFCLCHLYGYKIAKSAHIGFSYIFPNYLEMDEGARIGHLNVAIHLSKITMGRNSSIGRSNWITGFPEYTNSPHFAHDITRRCELVIGKETSITKNHHLDCTNSIHIGDFTTIAGYRSQFLTHSIDVYKGRQDSHPIEIGNYCFVSTAVKIMGGTMFPNYSVLGAGAVLTKPFEDAYCLYAGVPAKKVKELPRNAKYFQRKRGYVI